MFYATELEGFAFATIQFQSSVGRLNRLGRQMTSDKGVVCQADRATVQRAKDRRQMAQWRHRDWSRLD